MFGRLRLTVPAILLILTSATASAQRSLPPIGVHLQPSLTALEQHRVSMAATGGTPRWLKWGLVGAVAGAALFAAAGQSNTDKGHSAASDALYGAATGFVVLGGSIALWDWLCAGDTGSRRAGMCGG